MTADLPKVGAPAGRALAAHGIHTLRDVARHTEAELRAMHGVGPKAVGILRESLERHGLALRNEDLDRPTRKE
ncbi:hypothetical protein DVS28_b0206 (plasmid) [Euzebya pacifica]|uniref:Helix-hairpin-helix domain-containing protein n=1 Tax=Euzebya pacifica TaxID=1608957 RepID=A0A346Y679_9ACTN|nr:helix-hairpin-helix domain-containing protein [Euzebya pacifica]AXV09976.1 hypothetical protein DVS28_b0206 [Euzebya pacifica]